ncbi:MAG TPA: winged helix-turn-helix domain-containing protein [Acetobacteraceae bacterium]|nr:winged helix-turn-helix domain-containing protein [Acetobacteraceae bacterium]
MQDDTTFVFGRFRMLRRRRELLRDGIPVDLGSRAFDILLALVTRNGRLATKDELMAEVWPATVVDEGNLTTHISTLRRKLGDGSAGERYILTVPGRGYRFVAPIVLEDAEDGPADDGRSHPGGSREQGPARQQPSGAVAFLFTDIEGSTRRWASNHAAMMDAVAVHDRMLAECVGAHAGTVFKTVGDAVCAAFADTVAAIAAAVQAQRALQAADWSEVDGLRVRMAVHTGVVDLIGNDYFGLQMSKVARILSLAHGGQVIISGAAHDLASDGLPEEFSLVDLGCHQLKDLPDEERIFQVVAPGLGSTFPPLRSISSKPNNLPAQLTALIGRTEETAKVKRALLMSRLGTITGTGGLGKTRLALHVAAEALPRFPDGVWLVELAAVVDPQTVIAQFGKPFALRDQVGVEPLNALAAILAGMDALLVVDNCEHVLDVTAAIVARLLESCPKLRVIATSTQRLGIPGEAEIRLGALSTPGPGTVKTVDDGLQFDAVRLFVERALAADAELDVSESAMVPIVEICRQLDGIPLAIELAAARVRMLTLPELSKGLSRRFDILKSRDATRASRHQTLRNSIEWSYQLLTPGERDVFVRLGVFSGAFTMEAVLAVCASLELDELDIRESVYSLVDKSFVSADRSGAESRFRLLASIQAYARELLEKGGRLEAFLAQHASFYGDLADRLDRAFELRPPAKLDLLRSSLDNFRAALEWTIHQGNAPLPGANLAGALCDLWTMVPLLSEGRGWCEAAVRRIAPDAPCFEAGRAYLALATCLNGLMAAEQACVAADHACAHFRALDQRLMLARALRQRSWACGHAGDFAAGEAALEEALSLARREADRSLLVKCLLDGAIAHARRGEFDDARALFSEAEAAFRELGDKKGELVSIIDRAEAAYLQGEVRSAASDLEAAAALAVELDDKRISVHCLCNLAKCRLALKEMAAAAEAAKAALPKAREIEWATGFAFAVENLAGVAAEIGQCRESARLAAYAGAVYDRLGKKREAEDQERFEKLGDMLRSAMDEGEYASLAREGRLMTEADAFAASLEIGL